MDREVWRAVVHGVAKGQTRPSYWTELNWTEVVLVANLWFWNLQKVNPTYAGMKFTHLILNWKHEVILQAL